ncbi:MAG: L-serine ammonia-lyase, iron-sulfur-dependent, subunit alpha [Patescibacteria group bacterium]|jgi:L-cysteine desulfidase
MNILKAVLKEEVEPACGCTEPIAVAYACSIAARAIGKNHHTAGQNFEISGIQIVLDPGVFKNGMGVCIPNTNGRKGIKIAAAMGVICGDPDLQLEVLKNVSQADMNAAEKMVQEDKVRVFCNPELCNLHIEATIQTSFGQARAVIERSHTNVTTVLVNGNPANALVSRQPSAEPQDSPSFCEMLSDMTITDLVNLAEQMDEEDGEYIQQGIEMNVALAETGFGLGKFSSQLHELWKQALVHDDIFSSTKILVSGATDARMAGVNMPAMSSGGSGNQGIVAILVPYNVGVKTGVESQKILQSIALSHLLNVYIKQHTGKLAPICGCAIAAGAGAAAAIAHQLTGSAEIVGWAVDNVLADIAGMLCDGAKGGCTLKVITSADAAIRAAYFAAGGCHVTGSDGIIGRNPEETIKNLGRLCIEGMDHVDNTVLSIMTSKQRGDT